MKKLMLVIIFLVVLISCRKTNDNEITLNLKGEVPEKGEVSVKLYGYDKFLADHSATLILIHRGEVSDKVVIEMPADAEGYIYPPVRDEKGPSYYIRVDIVDGKDIYTQDFDKNPFIEVEVKENIDVYMKKK